MDKSVLAMIWDNARWHTSKAVHTWIRAHNRTVKRTGKGVRILVCFLPIKSPWLNPIEPKWAHDKRRIVEPNATLSKQALADRICVTFDCLHLEHLSISENVSRFCTKNDPWANLYIHPSVTDTVEISTVSFGPELKRGKRWNFRMKKSLGI